MGEWTPEREAEAEVWAKERGAKSRIIADALSEIARLRKRQELFEECESRYPIVRQLRINTQVNT